MRFALLGDHPDGLDMVRALQESGRHQVLVYSGSPAGMEKLARWGLKPRVIGDLEEILADPAIEAVIVAGGPALRPGQLRRTLQAERHALCVHPADDSPDLAYEAGMLQADTGCVLMPMLPEALHPGIRRFAELARQEGVGAAPSTAITAVATALTPSPRPPHQRIFRGTLLEVERWSSEEIVLQAEAVDVSLPGWDVLRLIGGEIGEVFALAGADEIDARSPVLLCGQFVGGGLFQATLLPLRPENRLRLSMLTAAGRAELIFPQGWPGPAELTYQDESGQPCTERWDAANPWPALVHAFEDLLSTPRQGHAARTYADQLTWQHEIRALELDDAVRRSVHRRRSSALEYSEATEEAGFKGTMTLVGCSILWLSLVLLIMSVWVPWLGWLILPVFGIFLVLQLLRVIVPSKGE